MRRSCQLFALPLERRDVPVTNPLLSYTSTEIMASIRGADPLAELQAIGEFDLRNSSVILQLDGASLVEVGLANGTDPLMAATLLAKHASVEWAEPNYVYNGDPRDYTPNDPQFNSQYHHTKTQNTLAWNINTGSPDLIVAIADDGTALAHPDIAANLWNNDDAPGNGIDDDGNGFIDDFNGWDVGKNNSGLLPVGTNSHGMHVAGIVAATTGNATGVAGIAGGGPAGEGVRLMTVQWYGEASWTSSVVATAYTYAANNGAKMVNASYNFDGWAPSGVQNATVKMGLDYAYSKGLLLVNSAGNGNALNPTRRVFDQIIFVANTDANDKRNTSSNYGWFVDVAAPGTSILATTTTNAGTSFTYGYKTGTSMASPNALGVAALIWSANPDWSREQVVAQLLATADNIDAVNPSYAGLLGTGRVNSLRALTESIPAPKFGTVTGLPTEGTMVAAMPSSLTVDMPMRFDPASVVGSHFEIRGDGPDNVFNTGDDVNLTLSFNGGAAYQVGTNRLNFTVTGTAPPDRYRFQAASGGLQDPFGQPLDGNGDGIGGDDYSRTFFVGTVPYVGSVEINNGVAQRSSVTSVKVQFSGSVALPANPANAFELKRVTDNASVTLAGVVATGLPTTVTLTFMGGAVDGASLADGRYVLTVLAGAVNGGNFDGNGDGLAGDNYVLMGNPVTNKLFRFFGDSDGDGTVAGNDFIVFRQFFNGVNAMFDFDGDGAVSASDFGQFRQRFGGVI